MRFVLTTTLLFLAGASADGSISFLKGPLKDALAAADAQKKPVMIDFITDWCRWCDTMDARTYSDKDVAAFVSANIISIKIDGEKGEGIGLVQKYSVKGFPTILLIKSTGEEIDRLVGYVQPKPFLENIRDFAAGRNTIRQFEEEVSKNPTDPELRYRLARKYTERFDQKRSTEEFTKLIDLDPSNTLGHNEEAHYTIGMSLLRTENDLSRLVSFVETYPQSAFTREVLAALTRGFVRQKDGEKAMKNLALYLDRWPDDAQFMNSYAWSCAEKGINLDHAADVAKKAVGLATTDGERAGYLDTQATVEFARGNVDKAILIEQQALDLMTNATPKERNEYQQTMAKFKAAQQSKK